MTIFDSSTVYQFLAIIASFPAAREDSENMKILTAFLTQLGYSIWKSNPSSRTSTLCVILGCLSLMAHTHSRQAIERAVWAFKIKHPSITCNVEVLLLGLAFHMEEPNWVRKAVNIFMFPESSLVAGNEATIARNWYTVLDSNMVTSYADKLSLMIKQRIKPMVGW